MFNKILKQYSEKIFLFVVCFLVIVTTKNVYMINTGDFNRAIFSIMPTVPPFKQDMSLTYPLYDEFWGLAKYTYRSTYTYLLYAVAHVFKLVTSTLDMRILSAILKVIYIFTFYKLYKKIQSDSINNFDFVVSAALILFVCSSSNIAFFPSFYQEQVLLICLPAILLCLYDRENTKLSTFVVVISALIIGGSKSQFFYFPIMIIPFVFWLKNYRKVTLIALIISQIICIIFVTTTPATTGFNKYHAAYYGVFAFEKMNGYQLPEGVDSECVGIDAWGGKLDKEKGSYRSTMGGDCYKNNTHIEFSDSIREFVRHPSILLTIPFDDIVKENYTTDYFHVAKSIKMIVDKTDSWTSKLTRIKDRMVKDYKIPISIILIAITFLITRNKNYLIISSLTFMFLISQLYISFFGEGYRDLSKHLFGMAFSFDAIIFISIATVMAKIKKK